MDEHGRFTVAEDSDEVIATALVIATAPHNADAAATALAPGGDGLSTQGIGSIDRITDREDLPAPFDNDLALDPDRQELWRLFREKDRRHPRVGQYVITGDELRALVKQALALRSAR
ncbi:MAG: hypothetical protein H0V17_17160 [Deltaproteobacteria bacterium]|nr:hypothetical protein [Deltaproteobacteria bacterium]